MGEYVERALLPSLIDCENAVAKPLFMDAGVGRIEK
jgi:hypothetical protein